MHVSVKKIKETYKYCEESFESCWRTLEALKRAGEGSKELASELIMFQEKLALALYKLQKLRNRIAERMRYLVGRKDNYKKEWFSRRMKNLSAYSAGMSQTINIGKAIGDAFVFFFYRNNLDLLESQYLHERIEGFVAGTGGDGEMSFLQTHKHLEGKFTIYHGITNILRYGDFSFYDLKTHEITQIAEMKTKKLEGNELELSLTLVGTKTMKKPKDQTTSKVKPHPGMDQKTADKLKRQVEAILKIVKPKKESDFSATLEGSFYFRDIAELFNKTGMAKPHFVQASEGLLFAGVRFPKASLYTRMFNRKFTRLLESLPDNIIEPAKKLIKKDSPNNSLIMGQLLYNPDFGDKNTSGTIPLFWYPLNPSLLKDLYFTQFFVLSLFNPAHLIGELHTNGYHVDSKYLSAATRNNQGGFKKGVQQFDLFISYIVNFLQSEKSVLGSVLEAERILLATGSAKMSYIKPQLLFDNLFQFSSINHENTSHHSSATS